LVLAKHGYRVVVNHRASASQAEEVVATIAAAGNLLTCWSRPRLDL
jgi:3-oxoacyl-[acyl-carrier protein] reductase